MVCGYIVVADLSPLEAYLIILVVRGSVHRMVIQTLDNQHSSTLPLASRCNLYLMMLSDDSLLAHRVGIKKALCP